MRFHCATLCFGAAALGAIYFARARGQVLVECLAIKPDKPRLTSYDKPAKIFVDIQRKAEQERRKAAEEQEICRTDANTLQPDQKVKAERAVNQLNKLFAATEVGISYREYGTRIVACIP